MAGYDAAIIQALNENDQNLNEIAIGLAQAANGADVTIVLKDLQIPRTPDGVSGISKEMFNSMGNMVITLNGSEGLSTGHLYAVSQDAKNKTNQSETLPLPSKKLSEMQRAMAQSVKQTF